MFTLVREHKELTVPEQFNSSPGVTMAEVSMGAGIGTVELSAGILHLKWSPGQAINEEDARAAVTAAQQLSGNRRYPMLVMMAAPVWLSCKARKVLALPDKPLESPSSDLPRLTV
ncbi:DUF7793 family protein [Arthrobacter sp. LjRoot14]|uniref:DUF7793 family protein n=1 Tax=Arthrobacter sp. LjRoot14 TaxID=3342265 RepID=UPI003ECF6C5C